VNIRVGPPSDDGKRDHALATELDLMRGSLSTTVGLAVPVLGAPLLRPIAHDQAIRDADRETRDG
jgi:hypothetical protein